jgi:hypothetical protein
MATAAASDARANNMKALRFISFLLHQPYVADGNLVTERYARDVGES